MTMPAASHIPVISLPKFKSYGAYDPALVDVLEPEEDQIPQPTEEELRQAEFERGLAEGDGRTRAHYEAILEREREAHAKALEDEMTRFNMRESANVSAAIEKFLDVMEQRLSYSLAKLLQPFLSERITEQLVSAFATNLRQLTEESEGKLIRLRGPEGLTSMVMEQLQDLRERIEVQHADQIELVALFDETTIETRLEQWLGQLEHLRKEAD
ncbi:hypothetical protein [Labrenzia sp. 011]|uniref:hypothetical protein n=1 Tax=Labrenzia sp. 011 TaxID=2171494 RepID=UPI000D5183B0|nr:hypothetical protein [Labrenzia sp. 011]PVB62684.1 hypothetical protein DCO57_05380 [Labrenzia sp. 011]